MQERLHKISRVTLWGALINIGLAVLKLAAGMVGRSTAMLADAIHSFSDLVSDVIVIVMVNVSSKGQDKNHDYGHGKFETLATVVVALLLIYVGIDLMIGGVSKILDIMRGNAVEAPEMVALWAALVSIAVKEFLYQWTARVGNRLNSPAMKANAWHHRTDALSSIGSALGIGGAILLGGKWAVLDPAVGCIISIFIIYIAVKMIIPALNELTEGSLPEETENDIMRIIASVEGIRNVHALKTRKNGPDFIIESHIVVNPEMSVSDAHEITEKAESLIKSKYGEKTQITIHVEPNEKSV